jgi:hypothetical protein
MKRSFAGLWSTAALVGLLVIGCNKDNNPITNNDNTPPAGVTNEQSAMQYYALNDDFVKNDEQTMADMASETAEPPMTDYNESLGKIDSAITPLRWGRFIRSIDRNVTVTVLPGDTMSVAAVHKTFHGVLVIKGIKPNGDTIRVAKQFVDQSDRNVIFKRRLPANDSRYWLRWLPVASSLIKGGTVNPADSISITKVQFFSASGDSITITDPLRFWLRYRWTNLFVRESPKDVPEIDATSRVVLRVTLFSASRDTDMVALRFGFDALHRRRARMTLLSQTPVTGGFERVYEKSWETHPPRGYFHAAIEAATKATLFDNDATKYSVSWWGIPYHVR